MNKINMWTLGILGFILLLFGIFGLFGEDQNMYTYAEIAFAIGVLLACLFIWQADFNPAAIIIMIIGSIIAMIHFQSYIIGGGLIITIILLFLTHAKAMSNIYDKSR